MKESIPAMILDGVGKDAAIGLVNMASGWWSGNNATTLINIRFDHVSSYFEWKDIFPEWIDEEEEMEGGPTCPEFPMPDYRQYDQLLDVVLASVPCRYPETGWARDVFRLQVHLVAAEMAIRKGRRYGDNRTVKVAIRSPCRPMMEIFRCDDLVRRESDWWFYEAEVERLAAKLALPVGSCKLALPLWEEGTLESRTNDSIFNTPANPSRREAYATVIHSSENYICGAISLAQSIIRSGTNRDLVLLHDDSISPEKLNALAAAGWKLHRIKRIRNPHAEKGSYNEYNYSKIRLWQLTSYSKILFIDSDVIVLKNLDLLFQFPQLSATGNDGVIFNSGVMLIEPSNCTFRQLLARQDEIVSYNGGDQGFLNEVFVWWHRFPRRVNFLKNFWANTTVEAATKNYLFASDPPELFSIHFLGIKPWHCYRDYDCNWDIEDQRIYASDVAHRRWWSLYDQMDDGLKSFCRLTKRRKVELEWNRKLAAKAGFVDEHWKLNISDHRRFE